KSYEIIDETTWEFELQEDVEFHDGTPFNADAVKYTFEKLIDPDTAAPGAHVMDFLKEVEVVDETTVRLITDGPTPNVLPALTTHVGKIISPTADQNQDLMHEPVGTGPFKFEKWNQ